VIGLPKAGWLTARDDSDGIDALTMPSPSWWSTDRRRPVRTDGVYLSRPLDMRHLLVRSCRDHHL